MRYARLLLIPLALSSGLFSNLAAQPADSTAPLKPLRVLALQGETHHVQGIDTDGVHLWVTAVDRPTRKGYLFEFALKDGRLERSVET
ncbi:MAG: hypothetical protein H7Y20_17735, partial [Bryobacteraceae bacterium]|nr:hypothetical protein [Bryobacteraceae bacterium]